MTFQQGFAWWSFAESADSAHDLLAKAAAIGYSGVDFLPAELWPHARDIGLQVVIIDGHESLEVGFNDAANHADLSDEVRRNLETACAEGIPYLAVNAGNRGAASDEEAIAICAAGLAPLAAEAAAASVTLLLEPLNSKIDHIGNQCDRSAWAAAVVDEVDSIGLRLLFDIYHMQIMEGDLIPTIESNLNRISHFHTAGVPGRHELDDRQEVDWRGIGNVLRACGYDGFVTHEFIPTGDPVEALGRSFEVFSLREM